MHDSDNYSTVIIAAPTIRPKQDNYTIMLYICVTAYCRQLTYGTLGTLSFVESKYHLIKHSFLLFHQSYDWLGCGGIAHLSVCIKPTTTYNLWTEKGLDMQTLMKLFHKHKYCIVFWNKLVYLPMDSMLTDGYVHYAWPHN